MSTFTDSKGRVWTRDATYVTANDGHIIAINPEMSDEYILSLIDPPLAVRQDAAWERIKAHRDMLSDKGGYKVVVGGVDKWFHSDGKSKTQQLALTMMGAAVPAVQWKTMDGTFVQMTQALASAIFQAAAAQDMAIFQAAETHRAAMLAASDPEAYDFSGGWPAVFPGWNT